MELAGIQVDTTFLCPTVPMPSWRNFWKTALISTCAYPIKTLSCKGYVSRTSMLSFKTGMMNQRWTKAICQAQTIKTFLLWEGKASDKWWGRLLRGIVTCIHMWSLASGNLVSGSLNVCLRTQYPCGYNYNCFTEEDCSGFIKSLNKKELIAPELPEKFLKCMRARTCTHTYTQYFWFPFSLNLHNDCFHWDSFRELSIGLKDHSS